MPISSLSIECSQHNYGYTFIGRDPSDAMPMPGMLIDQKVVPVVEILKRIIASGFVKNGYPLSGILISRIGAGKTTQIRKLMQNNILAMSDATPYGICKLLPEIRAKGIKHIIIFDLIEPFSRSRHVVNAFVGFMNSLIEEGIFRISTAFITVNEPIKLGLITSCTINEIMSQKRGWLRVGFISRMLPISFNFTDMDAIRILEDIAQQKMEDISFEKLKLKEKAVKENSNIFQKLIPYANNIDASVKDKPLPFRRLKQLQVLLMSNALLRGSKEVEEIDFEWFKTVVNWINFDFNPL